MVRLLFKVVGKTELYSPDYFLAKIENPISIWLSHEAWRRMKWNVIRCAGSRRKSLRVLIECRMQFFLWPQVRCWQRYVRQPVRQHFQTDECLDCQRWFPILYSPVHWRSDIKGMLDLSVKKWIGPLRIHRLIFEGFMTRKKFMDGFHKKAVQQAFHRDLSHEQVADSLGICQASKIQCPNLL